MNKLMLVFFFFCSLSSFSQTENYWVKKSDFGSNAIGNGLKRERAVAFSIGDFGYVGTGVDTSETVLNDFWKYDPVLNAWSQVATLPGSVRRNASSFAIGDNGYVCAGINTVNSSDFGSQKLNDLWEYNAPTNNWTQKSGFPGGGIYFSTGFSLNSKGYLCGGKMGPNFYSNSLWEYDPISDFWFSRPNFPGGVRYQMSSFTINDKAYVGLGADNDLYQNDIYEYNPSTSNWTQKADLAGSNRAGATAFSLGQRGFICMGTNGGMLGDLWQYNPFMDDWSVKANYGGSSRKNAVAFTINNKAYVGTGKGYNGKKASFYEYNPSSILAVNTLESEITIYPNPVQNILHLENISSKVKSFKIFALNGTLVYNSKVSNNIDVSLIKKGIYQLVANDDNGSILASIKLNKR